MKRNQVQVGKVYAVKVSGTVQPVRLTQDRGITAKTHFGYVGARTQLEKHDGWDGKNEKTGRAVRIRSAAKLRYELSYNGTRWVPAMQPKPLPSLESQAAGAAHDHLRSNPQDTEDPERFDGLS